MLPITNRTPKPPKHEQLNGCTGAETGEKLSEVPLLQGRTSSPTAFKEQQKEEGDNMEEVCAPCPSFSQLVRCETSHIWFYIKK